MQPKEWPDLVPLVQIILNNSQSPQRGNRAPITLFIDKKPALQMDISIRHDTGTIVTMEEATREGVFNFSKVKELVESLHPETEKVLQKMRKKARESMSRGILPKFSEGDFVLWQGIISQLMKNHSLDGRVLDA